MEQSEEAEIVLVPSVVTATELTSAVWLRRTCRHLASDTHQNLWVRKSQKDI